jgi:cytochrome c biogenesis protein CcdA
VTASQPPQPSVAVSTGSTATAATTEPSIGELVSQASEHLSMLVRAEVELAKLELRSSVKNAGVGAGMFAAAGVVLVFSLTFGFFALAEGLAAAGLYRWVAFLVVFGLLLIVVGVLAFLGVRKVKRVKAPQRTIETSRATVSYLREHAPRG